MAEETKPAQSIQINGHYVNGFQLGLSNSDISGILTLNGAPQISVNMSYTTAKSLANALQDMISTLEKVTDRKIMTTEEIGQDLENLNSEKAN